MNIKNINMSSFVKKLAIFFIGLFIIQIGVALTLKVNMGSDPFTVFTQGLSTKLNITVGAANRIISLVLFLIILFIDRRNINIGTLLSVTFVGIFLDFCVYLFSNVPVETYNILIKILIFCLSCLIIAIGFSILKSANIGIGPNDLLYFVIVDNFNKPYGVIRMLFDCLFLVIGFLLSGVVGLGTIIGILLTGPLIQLCLPKAEKIVNKII